MKASSHWIHQRISGFFSLAILPCMWILMYRLKKGQGQHQTLYGLFYDLLSDPVIFCFVGFVLCCIAYHIRLGVQTIVMDYVPETWRVYSMTILDVMLAMTLGAYVYSLALINT